jgi:predicted phage-related endonuclease
MILKPKELHGSDAWLHNRFRTTDGLAAFGYSDAPALAGCSPYKTTAELYLEKLNGPVYVEENWAMRKGNLMEPLWIKEAGERLGVELITPDVVYCSGRWVGSLDAVPADSWEKPTFIGEVKTTAKYIVNDASDLPDEWVAQGHMQAFVCQCPVYFIVFDKHQQFNIIEMPYWEAYANEINKRAEMYGELVDSKAPLSDDLIGEMDASAIAELYPSVEKTTVELPEEALNYLQMLDVARDTKNRAEEQEKQAKDALARLMLDAEVGTINGRAVVSWKQTAGKESFDAKQFKLDNPDLAQQYVKQGKPFRTMRMLKGAISE